MKTKRIASLIVSLAMALTMFVMPASANAQSYLSGDTDFNGKITSADFLTVQLSLVGQTQFVGNAEQSADVDGNNAVTSADALAITQHVLGIKTITRKYTPKVWSSVPMTTTTMANNGLLGGEGCQVLQYITFDENDGNIAYVGTDVGGMYKSTDGGITWAQSSVGLASPGAACLKTDPKNGNRILVSGVSSGKNAKNGVYLSTNGGNSFTAVLTNFEGLGYTNTGGQNDRRDSIAFDPSSYDAAKGYCTTAYFLYCDNYPGSDPVDGTIGVLYKSTDGGVTWTEMAKSADYRKGHIAVHPTSGYVYIAAVGGFYLSTNGGSSFSRKAQGNFTGMDVISTQPNNVYLCGSMKSGSLWNQTTSTGVFLSTDSGSSFSTLNSNTGASYPVRIEVSPVDPNYMVFDNDMMTNEGSYSNAPYYSQDGGATWTKASKNNTNSVIPNNNRWGVYAWSPTDKNICLSFGGDWVTRSTDGAKTFKWSNSGYNGAAVTDISVNVNDPSLMATTNQDYKGFYSTDYGKTWSYVKCWGSQGWGGYAYGSYAVTDKIIVGLVAAGWYDTRYIYVSTDGGKTATDTGIAVNGTYANSVTGMKGDKNIVFAANYRSTDKGTTWTKMEGCITVFGGDEKTVYGVNSDGNPVKSTDKGASWTVISTSYSSGVTDMCYDPTGNRLIVVKSSNVYAISCTDGTAKKLFDGSLQDSYGSYTTFRCVEVDPTNSNVIFLGNAKQSYATDLGLLKTTDGGKTWVNMTSTAGNMLNGEQGGRETMRIAINPATRHVFAAGSCRGIYKMAIDQ